MIRTTPPVAFRRPTWILRGDAAPEPPPRTEPRLLLDPGVPSARGARRGRASRRDRKSTRLNSSHGYISYAVFCLKKKKKQYNTLRELTILDELARGHRLPGEAELARELRLSRGPVRKPIGILAAKTPRRRTQGAP